MFKFETGERVQDIITKFKGIIMSRIDYLTGCRQYGISQESFTKEGKKMDWEYFDEDRLIKLPGKIILGNKQKKNNGFDGNIPEKK
ncbi:MAG: hypothetical protein WAX79_01745 [Candidatus Omnitrophota bacterium]